ncbi:ankyrin repeat domain-containing protein [Candidatus Reidiella endopervernicosa]|nr:ankyrin repeat domain-containing protein [Candidatus Reidiella endopervernicosa]QKQ25298.1 hypothetical protein HUE57_02570 [Candidatus Reidiella endopervernicosa]
MIRKLIIIIIFASLIPTVIQTWRFVNNTYGLAVLAIQRDDQTTLYPYTKESYFITPAWAMWLIENTDFHYYGDCSDLLDKVCGESLVAYVGGMSDFDVDQDAAYKLIDHFIKRGEPVNVLSNHGLAPLHESILYKNNKYLEILLENGADLTVRTNNIEREWHDKSSTELLEWLESNQPGEYSEAIKIISYYRD